MYILTAQFRTVSTDGTESFVNQNFFAKTKKPLKNIMEQAFDWRLNDGNCWIESKFDDSWKRLNNIYGTQCLYVI